MPAACMSAYIVVGPTNRKPSRRSSLLIAVDSGVVAGTSAKDRGGVVRGGGAKLHSSSSRGTSNARVALAFWMAASILPRWRIRNRPKAY